jgi:hypothetical protein
MIAPFLVRSCLPRLLAACLSRKWQRSRGGNTGFKTQIHADKKDARKSKRPRDDLERVDPYHRATLVAPSGIGAHLRGFAFSFLAVGPAWTDQWVLPGNDRSVSLCGRPMID